MIGTQDGLSQAGSRPEHSSRLLDTVGVAVERLPMLRVVFGRMTASFSEQIGQLAATPVQFSVKEIIAPRIGDVLARCDGDVIGAQYFVPEWDARLFLSFDRRFIATLIEALFGGTGDEWTADDRAFSNIDHAIAEVIFGHAAKALETSFAAVTETTLRLERVESRMEFIAIGRRSNFSVTTKIAIQALGHDGEMLVVIPQPAINVIRHTLEHDHVEGVSIRDPRWTKQLETTLGRTHLTLRAVIEEHHFTLADIANLRVGGILQLEATPQSQVKLQCKDQLLFLAQLGQGDGFYTVRVEQTVTKQREFIDDILTG